MKKEQKDIFILVKLDSGNYSLHSAKAGHEEWLGSGETLEKIEALVAKWCKRTGGSIDRLREKVFSFKPYGHTYPKWNSTVREMWDNRYSDMFETELSDMVDAGLKNSLFRPKLVGKKRKKVVSKKVISVKDNHSNSPKKKVMVVTKKKESKVPVVKRVSKVRHIKHLG